MSAGCSPVKRSNVPQEFLVSFVVGRKDGGGEKKEEGKVGLLQEFEV